MKGPANPGFTSFLRLRRQLESPGGLPMYVVILAGGSGTRFWPLSRKAHPKQLMSVFGDRKSVV